MSGARAHPALAATLPLAAGATLLLARWLPVSFEYRPNRLGIVSVATEQRYPLQQEVFWALFAGLAAGLFAWMLGRALGRGAPGQAVVVRAELLGAAALLAALWLPPPLAAPGFALLGAGACWMARRSGPPLPPPVAPRPRPGARSAASGAVGALILGALLAPGVWENLWSVAARVPDAGHVGNHFKFLAETGQHLAWADALWRGELHGRDFFCLYGPLYDLGIVGVWKLLGRSIAGFELYWSLSRVLGWTALLTLGLALLRRPALALLLPFLLPWVKLRVGLALFGLLFLVLWMRRGAAAWAFLAGAAGGAALLYSQEFGLCFALSAGVGLALRRDGLGALCMAAGLGAVAVPLLGYYAAEGALLPMLRDLAGYPSYVLAGFGKLPFPALLPALPLDPWAPSSREALELRLGYATPAIAVAALLLLLPVAAFDPRHPLASLRALRDRLARDPDRLALVLVALFGLLAFRSALGRSQLAGTLTVVPPVALLLVCGLDRALALARTPGLRVLAAWRAAALLGLVCWAGFPQTASPLSLLETSVSHVGALLRSGHQPRGSAQVMRVVRYVQLHTEAGEAVLFLPNDAAYYYLSQRPNPIRFVLGHQMVTDAHRAEALNALRRRPPRYVVWDHGVLVVDDIPDERVFGRALLDWLESHYETERRLGEVEILRLRQPHPS